MEDILIRVLNEDTSIKMKNCRAGVIIAKSVLVQPWRGSGLLEHCLVTLTASVKSLVAFSLDVNDQPGAQAS